jgi:hypothetical protein
MLYCTNIFTLVVFVIIASTYAQEDIQIQIVVSIPSGSMMESLTTDIAQGSIKSDSPASFSVLNLNLCSKDLSGTTEASLQPLNVEKELRICAKGTVAIEGIKVLTSAVAIELQSQTDNVTTKFMVSLSPQQTTTVLMLPQESFAGTYMIKYTEEVNIAGDCVKTVSQTGHDVGVCRHGKYSTFVATGKHRIHH